MNTSKVIWTKACAEHVRQAEARYRDAKLDEVDISLSEQMRAYMKQPNGDYPRVEVDKMFAGLLVDMLTSRGHKAVIEREDGKHFVRLILSEWVEPAKTPAADDKKGDQKEDEEDEEGEDL